jgi:NAD(P)-dependent dehydrogenase (short-subunit alcohol dehydrogenase family)
MVPSMSQSRGVAVVTGGSRGIGRGIAVALAGAGMDVVINYAGNKAAAEECQALCQQAGPGGRYEICQGDIGSSDDRARLVDFVRGAFGRIDLLVNNAGVAPTVRADMLEADEASFDRLIDINLKGPYFLTQRVARWMIDLRASLPASYAPKIVTITSISAYTASVNRGDYCLSKAGLAMLTKLFAVRLADHGIGVYEIRPGVIQTDMTAGVTAKYDKLIGEGLTPIRRWGLPDDVGKAVAAVALGHFPFSTGEVINVDGGFHLKWL